MRLFLFLNFFVFLFIQNVSSQQRINEVYEGDYSIIDSEQGKARYGFYTDEDGMKIKNGSFSFASEHIDSLDSFFQRKINGTYSNGLKDKKWTYVNNVFKIKINTVSDKFQVQSTVDGKVQKLNAEFESGKASGNWRLEEYSVEQSEQTDRLRLLVANFHDGRLRGDFLFDGKIDGQQIKINGQFSKEHFFDGEWELSYMRDSVEFLEKRIFENGFLLSLNQKDLTNDIVFHDIINTRVKEKIQNVKSGVEEIDYTIGNDFFGNAFDDGFPLFSEESISQRYGNEVLAQVFNLIIDPGIIIGMDLEGITKLRPGGTRRFEYTLTNREKEALNEAETLVTNYTSDLEKFVNNTTLSLNRQRSDSLSYSFRLAERMLKNFKLIGENIELLKSDNFKYQSKRTYFRSGIEGVNPVDTIRYTFDGEERQRIIANSVDFSDSDKVIFNIKEYVEEQALIIERLDPFFKDEIIIIEQDMVSQQLEEDLLNSLAKVKETYDIQRGFESMDKDGVILTRFHISMFQNYERKLDLLMQAYSTSDGFEEKQERGLEILNLAQTYYEAYEPIGEVRKKLQQLDEAYTKISYNPYMDRHDIKTRIKRNIYFAAIDYLLPDYRERIINAEDFEEIPDLIEEMNSVFNRLIEIANKPDSETRSIERRLRRESNPNRIKRIIDL